MPTLPSDVLEQFANEIFVAKGVPAEVAAAVANSLVLSNLRGHDSHGIIRVIQYVDWMDRGWVQPKAELEVIQDRGAILIVDGHYQFGQLIGRQATALAIGKAKEEGVCILTIRRSSHLGRMGEFMEMAADAGLVSFSFTNTHGGGVLQAPHGGREARLSANPLAAGAPVPGKVDVIMDFATSMTAEGKVKVAQARGEQVPEGCLVDGQGMPTTDPDTYYGDPKGAILPAAGHKGYALAVFADILAGAVAGGSCSHANVDHVANGWFAIFVDPGAFCGQGFYEDQVSGLTDWIHSCPTREGFSEVMLPGEPEARATEKRRSGGIPIEDTTWQNLTAIAEALGVSVPVIEDVK